MDVEESKKAGNPKTKKTENQKTEAPTVEQSPRQRKLKKYNKIKFPKL